MRFSKRIPATVLAVATASALVLAPATTGSPFAPQAQAQEQSSPASPISKTVNTGAPATTVWGGKLDTDLSNFGSVSVSYPENVEAGETFEVTIQPGALSTKREQIGRIKYDIALPANAAITSMTASDGSGFGTIGRSSTTAYTVIRVDKDGNPSASGAYARITSTNHQTVNNGPSWHNNDPKAGLSVPANTPFQLPKVTFTLQAPAETGSIVFGLRGAGQPAGPKNDTNIENTMSFAEDGTWKNDAVYVNAGAAGAELLKVNVVKSDIVSQVSLNQANLTSTTPNENSKLPVSLEARATRQKDDSPLPNDATVQFQSRTADGQWTNIGDPVTIDGNLARTTVEIDDVDGEVFFRAVVAEYTTPNGFKVLSSESDEKSVTVTAENKTTVTLGEVPESVEPGVEVPLTATYTVDGRPLPEGTTPVVVFKANGEEIGQAEVDEEGNATLNYTFDAASEAPVEITAEVAEIVDANAGNRTWPAAASGAKTINVKYNQRESTTTITSPAEGENMGTGFKDITARVDVADDRPIGDDAKVEFWVYNEDFSEGLNMGEGNNNGDGTFTISRPFAPGASRIEARFLGSATALPSTSAPVNVTADEVRITVSDKSDTTWDSATKADVTIGDETDLKVTVTHSDSQSVNRQPVKTGQVEFYIGEEKIGEHTLSDADNGVAAIKYDFADKSGEQVVVAKYLGVNNAQNQVGIEPSESSFTFNLAKKAHDTKTAVSAEWSDETPVEGDNPADISATVTDAEGNPAPAGIKVEFFNGENTLGTATTDENGVATLSDVTLSNDDHTIKAVVEEQEVDEKLHSASEGTAKLSKREVPAEQPETPEEPDTPENPADPEAPDAPEEPGTPDNPDQPGTPEDPADPEVPQPDPNEPPVAEPENPGTPEDPTDAEEPGTSEDPTVIDIPAPTWVDPSAADPQRCGEPAFVEIPETDGVEYEINGKAVDAGKHEYGFNGPEEVKVTAKPRDGYAFSDDAVTEWTWRTDGIEECPPVTPGDDKPGTDKPGTDKPGTDTPGTDKPGTDKPGTDTPGTDKPGTDKPGTDTPGGDKPGTDKPGTDKPGDNDGKGQSSASQPSVAGSSNGSSSSSSTGNGSGMSSSSSSKSQSNAESNAKSESAKSSNGSLAKTGVTAVASMLGIAAVAVIIGIALMAIRRKNDDS